MKFTKIINTLCIFLLIAGVSCGATTKTKSSKSKIVSIDDVAKYVGKTVTLKSDVIEIEHAGSKALIELDKNFKVVCDTTAKAALLKAGIDVEALPGGTVEITGKLYKDARYGIQMDVTKASQVVVVKAGTPKPAATPTPSRSASRSNSTTGTYTRSTVPEVVIPFEGVISISEVTAHIGQTGKVQGKVVNARKSGSSNTYFLDFSNQQKVFTVVIFNRIADQFSKDSVDILAFKGKDVQITGKIVSPQQYGPEILLDKSENIKVVDK